MQMLEEYPASSERIKWWDSLGEVLYLNNNWIEAILAYEEALKEFPENVKFHINLGWAYYESGAGVKPALDQFNKLIDLVPESGGGEYSIARLLTREKLYTEADEYFQEALIKNPEPDWWYLERANTAIKAQNNPLAIEIYKGLIERNPNYSPAYFGIAKSYQQANQIRQAVSSIDTALNLTNSPSYNQYIRSGEIYEWAGEKEKALNAYTQAFIVNPDSESALEAINRIKND
jgi:tetratricopeptide (TPR) repeat protein